MLCTDVRQVATPRSEVRFWKLGGALDILKIIVYPEVTHASIKMGQ